MKKGNGFTLVELLVVVGILGILSGLVIVSVDPKKLFQQSRDSRRLSDLTTIQSALEQYFAQNNAYPATDGVPFGAAWTPYLKTVPSDPSGAPAAYEYCADATQDNYVVCATMETTPLPSDCKAAAYTCTKNCCLTNPF